MRLMLMMLLEFYSIMLKRLRALARVLQKNYTTSIMTELFLLTMLFCYCNIMQKAAGHSDIEWPPARYEFGQVVQYDSTQSLYMLYDESGKCVKFLTNGDVFTVLKSVGNNKYMISYDAGIYYIKIENYNSFVYLYDVRHFTYMSFYTYPDIGDIAFGIMECL